MTRWLIRGGGTLDIPSADETAAAVDQRHRAFWHEQKAIEDARLRDAFRGVKWMRLPTNLQGKPASSAITLGITKGQPPVGPEQGYAWTILRLVVTGLASGATPDVVNLYLNDNFSGPVQWQFNGNNLGYTFAPCEMVLLPGDTLALQNSGTITATGNIILSGELIEVPAEMLPKLAVSV